MDLANMRARASKESQMTTQQRQVIIVVAFCILGALVLLYGFSLHG
jgi:hypothetical protein